MCRLPLLAFLVVVITTDLASPGNPEGDQLDLIEGRVKKIQNNVDFIKKKIHQLDRVKELMDGINAQIKKLPADIEKRIKAIEDTVKKAMADLTPKQTAPQAPDNLVRDNDGYILAFRLTAGINQSAYDRYVQTGKNDDDNNNNELIRKSVPCGCKSTDGSQFCDRHYRSVVLDLWERLPIQKVKVGVYKKGKLQKSIVFNGKGSTSLNFFQKSRIANSSYTDLTATSKTNPTFFTISGSRNRHFFINGPYLGCYRDAGWLAVIDTDKPDCKWEKNHGKYPVVIYSNRTNMVNWGSCKYAGKADVLTVSVLLEETNQCKA